jgi:hypothetical protein
MYANEAQMPATDMTRKKKHRVAEGAAVAAGVGTAYAGFRTGQAMKKVGAAADKAAAATDAAREAASHVNTAVHKGKGFLKGARKQLTTFPTFKKIVGRFMASGVEPSVELGIFRRRGASVAQDKYRKKIEDTDIDRAASGYVKTAATGAAIGVLTHPHRRTIAGAGKGAAIGAAAGVAAQAAVRHFTGKTKDQYGDRSHTAKAVDRIPGVVGVAGVGGVLASKVLRRRKGAGSSVVKRSLRKVLNARMQKVVELGSAADVAARVGQSTGQRVGDWFKKRWASAPAAARAAVVGAGALGGAGAVAGAVAPDKGETRTDSTIGHAAKDGVFGAALYGATEPLIKKVTGANADGDLVGAAKKLTKKVLASDARRPIRLSSRLASRLVELRATHHSDAEGRDDGGKFEDSLKAAIYRKPNYQGREVQITDRPVIKSAYRKAQTVRRVGARAGGLAKDAVDHLRGVRKVDERGRPKKREWEKTWFKNGVANAAIAGGGLAVANHLRTNKKSRDEVAAVKHGVFGQKDFRVKTKLKGVGGKPVYRTKKYAPPKTGVGRGIVKGAERVRRGARKVGKLLFSAGVHRRMVELDYYDRADWDLRDPRGKSARVFAPGSRQRQRRPKKWHEKADSQRKIGAALTVAGTAAGLLVGRKLGIKKGLRQAEARLAPKAKKLSPLKGTKREMTHDGPVYHRRRPA